MPVSLYSGQVTLNIEVALSAATSSYGIWNTGLWDTALWGPDVAWTDVSGYMASCTTQRGFARELQVWQPGTATIVLNNADGRFSSANLSGPYVTGGITQIRPWRPVRVRAAYGGVTYDIFRGYALAWDEGLSIGTGDAVVAVSCIDEYGRLAKFNGAGGSPVGAGESSGARIHRLLDYAGFTGARAIDVGQFTVQATTLSSNVADEASLTAESEAGAFYAEADGSAVFEDGYALVENSRSNTIQATFGDDDAGVELEYVDIKKSYDGNLLTNIAAFQRVGGTMQTAVDEGSRSLYVPSQASRSDLLCATDAQALQLASWYVTRYAQPEDRFTQIKIEPQANPSALFPQALGRRVRDLVRATRRRDTYTITRDCHISGVSHTFTDLEWTTTFGLWSATPYLGVGLWDSATWDTSKWFF